MQRKRELYLYVGDLWHRKNRIYSMGHPVPLRKLSPTVRLKAIGQFLLWIHSCANEQMLIAEFKSLVKNAERCVFGKQALHD